ncbi:retropepsin-like aspartic protease family protein [Tunicatimonas pelagia]|uniref:retropepsin-like aspartic protease family protein n=1 Tax=Tunicatimonas pelagia TaxID=931531 RepID=UPI002665826B|nr:aspartyl protease family protein [Tunicatimonas pelagia]WKN41912.1 aspartyl protease family protein [Tunicatimonas pelagia]
MASVFRVLLLVTLLWMTGAKALASVLSHIPFTLHNNHIFINIQVNDSKPLRFIFDTGASATVISEKEANHLDITHDGFSTVRSQRGPKFVYYSNYNKLRVGEVTLSRVKMVHLPLRHLHKALDTEVYGIIGQDILKEYTVEIDYDQSVIILHDPHTYTPPPNYHQQTFDLIGGRPYIAGSFQLSNGETLSGKFQLDNGSGSFVTLYSPFVDEHQLTRKIGRTHQIYTMNFSGVIDRNFSGRLQEFEFGWFSLSDIPIRLNQSRYYKKAFKDGIGHIGNALLKRFNIVLDYHHKQSYWHPNESFANEFSLAYSGLVVKSDNQQEKVVIRHVFEDSPADKAGFTPDDEIVEINNISASGRSSHEVQALLNRQTQLEVTIRRQNQVKTINLYPLAL